MAESDLQLRIRRLRRDGREDGDATVVAYLNEGSEPLAWTGDDSAPYVKIIDWINGVVVQVMGDIAHDSPDLATSFPVKVGGHANVNPRAAVSAEDDRADMSTDLRGRLRTRISGEQGGLGVDVAVGTAAQVLATNNLLGAFAYAAGNVAHDAVDSNNPLKIGGKAVDETPAAVADLDRVDGYFTLEGRQIVNQDLLNAGEDLVNNVLGVVHEPLAVQQHSMDWYYDAAATNAYVVKASAGRVFQIYVSNESGGVLFLTLHNLAAAPTTGVTAPSVTPWRVPNQGALFLDFSELGGLYFDTGIAIGNSTVVTPYTNAGATRMHVTVLYK